MCILMFRMVVNVALEAFAMIVSCEMRATRALRLIGRLVRVNNNSIKIKQNKLFHWSHREDSNP